MARAHLPLGHAASQAVCLVGLGFIPAGGWLHTLWQTLAGWLCASFLLLGVRRFRPRPPLLWYLFAAGLFFSGAGTTVEMIAWRCCGVTTNPNVADVFWLSLHACLITGLGFVVWRQAAREELGAGTITTIACALLNLFVGVFAWQNIVWAHNDYSLTLTNRFVVTLYPLADLLVIALILRLLLAGGYRNASLLMLAAAMGWFLLSDVGWSDFIRGHAFPDRWRQLLVEGSSMVARALLAGAALVPSARTLAPPVEETPQRLGALGWLGMAASVLTAPLVLLLQALLDRLYSVSSF
jgi:hypothetical protein